MNSSYKNERTAVICGPIFNSVNTLLKMSLDCSHIFRTVAYSEVINIIEPSVLVSRQLTMLFIFILNKVVDRILP